METTIKNGKMKTIPLGLAAYGFTGSDQPQCAIVVITPTMAIEWLKKNICNRPLSKKTVKRLEAEINAGYWKVTNDAICFNKSKYFFNGQHRLTACVNTGKNITAIVAINLEDKSFVVMDSGKKRNLSDSLAVDGKKDYTSLAAATKLIMNFKKGNFDKFLQKQSYLILNTEGYEFAENNTKLEEVVSYAVKIHSGSEKLIPISQIAGLIYIMSEKGSEEKAKEFFKMACSGFGFDQNSPIAKLLKVLRRDKLSQKGKLPNKHKMALIIKTWNAWFLGKDMKILTYNSSQKFPSIK